MLLPCIEKMLSVWAKGGQRAKEQQTANSKQQRHALASEYRGSSFRSPTLVSSNFRHHKNDDDLTTTMVRISRRSSSDNRFLPCDTVSVFLGLSFAVIFYLFWNYASLASPVDEHGRPTTAVAAVRGGSQQTTSDSSTATVAYAVSVTGCGSDPITEGGAVLRHSIHRASSRGTLGGRYDYALFAIYHPEAEACSLPLADLGFTLLRRDTPVSVDEIQGHYLRNKIQSNGCCGEKELIKLEAYTLTNYPVVVHLDLDVVVLKPLDNLFDAMLALSKPDKSIFEWPDEPVPDKINAFFTLDYNMVKPHIQNKPVQGGFLVLRPDVAVYEEFREIVREGDFREKGGWGGKVGPFYGSMTFQGIIPYYYNVLHPGQAVELNRCLYNQMADNPRTEKTVNDIVHGKCRTGADDCEDCRNRPIDEVVTTHFTLCQKPWWCVPHTQDMIQHRLCRKLTHEWYKIRSELEQSWGRSGRGSGSFDSDQFYGYCASNGKKGYLPIEKPYGPQTVVR
jgi:hypothetical protein